MRCCRYSQIRLFISAQFCACLPDEKINYMITYFDNKNWGKIIDSYEAWWADTLERPLLNIRIYGADPKIKKPDGEMRYSFSGYGLDVPVEMIIKHCEYSLCTVKYIGDAYPSYLPDFGAGINAAFQGARFIANPDTVWFEADGETDMKKFQLYHHPDNILYRRISEFYEKAGAYFQGDVVLGMTHLNNGIDIPARFFDAVEFCTALYDMPEEINRLVWENHRMFLF